MTQLLERAFVEVTQLLDEQQDAIAALILAEIESERRWEEAFAQSQDELAKLAEEALAEHRAGKTKRLDLEAL